ARGDERRLERRLGVRVVHVDGEGLAAVDRLHAAGDRPLGGEGGGDRRVGQRERLGGGGDGEEVREVVAAEERRPHGEIAARGGEGGADALRPQLDVAGDDIALALRPIPERLWHLGGEAAAVGVVQVHHRAAARLEVIEEPPLGGEVALHVEVVVEVVARQVGEDGDVEGGA